MQIRVIDSHTGGEPTRTIVSDVPLVGSSVAERLSDMQNRFDDLRKALIHEPRGSEVMVGALLLPPIDSRNAAGVIFFNNVGYLGETLRWLGKLQPGVHVLETCVGEVQVLLHEDRRVTLDNVPSYRIAKDLPVTLSSGESLLADIAYGGNHFALVDISHTDSMSRGPNFLIQLSTEILQLVRHSYPDVDHVDLFDRPSSQKCNSRSFVLCPGGQYDRSPCGTGTSAKLACLAADDKLSPGEIWHQESYIGSVFEASYQWVDKVSKSIRPSITSRAFVNGDLQIIVDPEDPFCWGIPTSER
jgi:proline racemase